MPYISLLYHSWLKYYIIVYILFPLLAIHPTIRAQNNTQRTNIKDSLTIRNNLSPYQKYISAYNQLLKLVQTNRIIRPNILGEVSSNYLKFKTLFEKNRDQKDYQKQIAAYNRLAQLITTKKITAPTKLANAQADYFKAKKFYMESFKNKKVRTSNIPNVANKKIIYKKYIEAYKNLLDTMNGDMKGEEKTPEQKRAFKKYQYWKKKYEESIKTNNIK